MAIRNKSRRLFTPDSKLLISFGRDNSVSVWSVADGKKQLEVYKEKKTAGRHRFRRTEKPSRWNKMKESSA